MKKLFTLAIIAMIASLSFAQASFQKASVASRQIEKTVPSAKMQKAMEAKSAFEAKTKVANETSGSVLRHAEKRPVAAAQQLSEIKAVNGAQITRTFAPGEFTMSQFKNKKAVASVQKVAAVGKVKNVNYNANAPRYAAAKNAEATEIVATDASAAYYAEDGDWYCVLQNAQNAFAFDIVTNNPAGLELNHEYTLADMDPSYSYCMVSGSQTLQTYSAATFKATEGAYGNDYEATATLSNGNVYHVTYTSVAPETIEVEVTTANSTYYGAPDNDWFVILKNANLEFRFDIGGQSADGLVLGQEYTLADMIADYSWGKDLLSGASISYKTVSFKALQGANGTDYAATVVDTKGNTYNIKYTTVAPPEPTETVEVEFTSEETDLVDAITSVGLIQFTGAKDNGFEVFVAFITNQVAGEYTFEDIYPLYTGLYLDDEDLEGVACVDLTATVTDLGNGAYKAVVEYLGDNAVLYKLTFNYGEAGGGNDEVVVTKDANGIITNVTGGESKTYTREGTAYYVSSGSMYYGDQSGTATIIEDAENGKVYMKDPISRYTQGSWVEGTIEDGKIVVAAKQPLAFNAQYSATISLRWGVVDASGSIAAADAHADNFVYVIDDDKLILQGTESFDTATGDAYFMGSFWDDDDSATGYGDAETVLTYDPDYVAPSTDLVVLPSGADILNWNMSGTSVSSSASTPFQNQAVNIAFDGNDIYIAPFSQMAGAWIKGTKEGNTVTFKKLQYLGTYGGSYEMYFTSTDGEGALTDATATLSADAQTLTFNSDLIANAATDRIYYLEWLQDVVISAEQAEEPVITNLTAALPYANSFDTEAEQLEAAIYDANGDGKTFTFASDSKTSSTTARYAYSSSNAGDDYVVFPGLTFEAGKSYKVSVDARSNSSYYPERIEIVAGTVAKASELTTVVLPATDLTTGDYENLVADFTPEVDGVYYIALHAISDADQFYLYTDNFSVKENNMNAPEAPQNLVVTPDAEAGLSAAIVFNAPSKNVGGADLVGNVTCVVMRNGEVIFGDVVVAPGATVELTDDNVPASGTYVYSVFAITKEELASDAATAKVYIGEDIPDDVENLEAIDKNGKVALSWDAPADGVNAGIIIAENLTYNVYPVEMIEFFGMQFPEIDFENPYMTGLTATEAEVEFDTNSGAQTYAYFGVTAENTAGESMGTMAATLVGAPYDLPFVEEFPNGSLTYWWGVDYDDDNYEADGGLGLTEDGQLVFDAQTAGWIELYSGKIAMNGATKPQLTFDYSGEGALSVIVYGPTKEMAAVALTPGADVKTAAIDLTELLSEPWIRFTVHGEYEAAGQTFVDNFVIMDMVDNDLEVSVSAPKSVVAGGSAKVVATVKNVGATTASDYAVKFYVNEEEVETVSEVEAIEFLATAQYTYTLETSIFDEAGDVTVKAEVVFAADEKPETNTDEVVVTVAAPSATPVATVSAEETEQGVVISWTVSENVAQEVTEDFESYEVGIFADGTTMGPWSAKDGDMGMGYGWESASIAWDYTGEAYAFAIMNFSTVFGSTTDIVATSGEQALMFMSVTDEQGAGFAADDWFISPELPGVAQTVSFQARPMTANYGAETLEVMASTDGQNWTKAASYEIEEESFEEYSVSLAEGTKYFALHYTSNDIFALFIDDVKYTVGGGVPTGFNVYVDKALVASVDAEAGSYTYTAELAAGSHDFSVSAVYGNSESAPVSCTVTGIENISVAKSVEIFTVDGVRVNDVKNLKAGVYVVNGKKLVVE